MAGRVEKKKIKDRLGAVRYEGFAASRKELVERLVAGEPKCSMAGVDLSGADLSGLDLSGADFTGAKLSGTDFRGSVLKVARFVGADMKGAKLQGARLDRAVLDRADLSDAEMVGARATCASFCGATLHRADLTDVSASSAQFNDVRAEETSFVGAELFNAGFRGAWLIECDFRGAKLEHRIFGGETADTVLRVACHLPDRTAGAVVVGCDYGVRKVSGPSADEAARLSETVPAMRADRNTGRATSFLLWSASTLTAVLTVENGADYIGEYAHALGSFGAGFGFVAVMGGVYLLKEKVVDYTREHMRDGLHAVVRKVREAMAEMEHVGIHRMNLACMVARDSTLDPIRMAMAAKTPEARRRGWWGTVKSFFCELGHVVLCDRRHLALALATLSSRRHHSYPLPGDIVLMRCHGDHAHGGHAHAGPCAISFLADGRTTATWAAGPRRHVTTQYSPDGSYRGCWDADGQPVDPGAAGVPEANGRRLDTMLEFEASLLSDHGLAGFDLYGASPVKGFFGAG